MPEAKNVLYSVEFFDLQLRFAAKAAELSGTSFVEAVGNCTNLYVRLGMGHRLDAANPDWQDFVTGLVSVREPAQWTHAVHRHRIHLPAGPALAASVGCFGYALVGPDRVRLHFHAGDRPGESLLSAASRHLREGELASLLSALKAASGDGVRVVGASWLYNLRSYRRLFPERYLASLHAMAPPCQRMPLWGQFLDRDRNVRPDAAARFLAGVASATDLAKLGACFPLPVLATTAPVTWLYDHFGL